MIIYLRNIIYMEDHMILSEKDGDLFYELWLPLLDYVNNHYKINKKLMNKIHKNKGFNNEEIREIADKLWDDISLLDKYLLEDGKDLPEEHKQIILSWKRVHRRIFVLERHLSDGSILMDLNNNHVYQCVGIKSNWDEIVHHLEPLVLLMASLIPFNDKIISDGIVIPLRNNFSMKDVRELNKLYHEANKNNEIIKSL